MKLNPRVSIITVSYNSALTIEDTIKSVLGQTAIGDVEYVIVDGGSTDGTVDIIKQYEDKIARWVSENDGGIYDAMNKGIRMATGDVIGILNSDDTYKDPYVLENIAEVFKDPAVDSSYGDLSYVSRDAGKVVRNWVTGRYDEGAFFRGWHPPHPTFFVRRRVYERCGLFNLGYPIAADYELMLRFLVKCRISTVYVPKVLVMMRAGGHSSRDFIKRNVECYRAWKENGISVSPLIIFKRLFYKRRQLSG